MSLFYHFIGITIMTKLKNYCIIKITIFWSQRLAFDSMNSGYAYFKMLLLLNQKYYISVTLTCSGKHVGDKILGGTMSRSHDPQGQV